MCQLNIKVRGVNEDSIRGITWVFNKRAKSVTRCVAWKRYMLCKCKL